MHIAVLVTNTDDSAFAARHPGDLAKFRAVLPVGWRLEGFDLPGGVFPGDLAAFDGVIIGGSPASVNDGAEWVGWLLAVVPQIVARGQPLFGACFGHQAIAKALGGRVADNPGGWVFGVTETEVVAPAPWMEAGMIRVQAAHSEQVVELPGGARVLARNGDCAVGAFAIGERVFAMQYHPEISAEFMAALVEEYAGKMPVGVARAARESLAVPADLGRTAAWIVRFFEQAQDSAARRSIAVT